jgi:hypothetical protein
MVLNAVAKWRITVNSKLSSGTACAPKMAFPNSKCPLEETGKNSVNPWMIPRMMASINSKLFLVFVRFQQNGIYLDAQSDEHQGRRQTDASEVVNIGIKDVRVITSPTAHQYKPQGNENNSYK